MSGLRTRAPEAVLASHPPLSEDLVALLAVDTVAEPLTLNGLFARAGGRGLFLLIILLCLPFLTPVSIPGSSILLGGILFVLGLRFALNLPPRLPRWIGERPLPPGFHAVLAHSVKVLRFLEKWVRPRRAAWLGWRLVRVLNGMLLVLMASLLLLPIPPVVPLTNTLPAYAILLVALGVMEDDVAMIWLGYGAVALTLAYFWAWAHVFIHLAHRYLGPALDWLQKWL